MFYERDRQMDRKKGICRIMHRARRRKKRAERKEGGGGEELSKLANQSVQNPSPSPNEEGVGEKKRKKG